MKISKEDFEFLEFMQERIKILNKCEEALASGELDNDPMRIIAATNVEELNEVEVRRILGIVLRGIMPETKSKKKQKQQS